MPTEKLKAESEIHPDAWQRFEKAVDIGLATKPMHREAPKPSKKKTAKKSVGTR